MSELLSKLGAWRGFTAVVVGDYMLDELVFGNADRLSPEAPVPVLHVQREEHRPGGAANVSLNLIAMRGAVRAIGVIGADAAGERLRSQLSAAGVDASGLVADGARPTTRKRSLIGLAQHRHPQKMFREDHESREPLSSAIEESLMAALERALGGADVVCLEDYNKGVCTARVCGRVIELARQRGIEVLVDPAAIKDYSKYRGAAAITPNRTEAMLATGLKLDDGAVPGDYHQVGVALRHQLDLDAAVVTLDRLGILLCERGGAEPVVVPTVAREVYDVSGAGDMVLAALAGSRANKIDWHDACVLANAAAGLEVQVFGVVPIPIERIHAEVLRRVGSARGKLRSLSEAVVEAEAARREQRKIVFTNGCFDLLHSGHVWLLETARSHGDYLIVGINTDARVREYKGNTRPIMPELERATMLSALSCVDAVVVFDEETPIRVIQELRPDVLVKGGEYSLDEIPGATFVQSYGGRVVQVEMKPGLSTTSILRRLGAPADKTSTSDVVARFTHDRRA